MARPLPSHPLTEGASHLCLAIGSVFFCALTLFMCAGHSRKWVHHLKACYSYSYEEPVIQLNGFQDEEEEEEEEEEESVWQKNILMGGKCQLPDFSGVIIYDSQGNIAPTKPRLLALTWK
ncbi:hypothetical protein Ccrd_022171 [Cynara cardunculus var. scolymus]|uniref:Uncharacterized protein n=1 Tax=Cynara cardunculus var. scolymus TaxID=59895 RepID=A0A103XZ67_CYNCS|nr:hypothetical protein Ccrd_022171 [Cynara cardunculus var. scolymus]